MADKWMDGWMDGWRDECLNTGINGWTAAVWLWQWVRRWLRKWLVASLFAEIHQKTKWLLDESILNSSSIKDRQNFTKYSFIYLFVHTCPMFDVILFGIFSLAFLFFVFFTSTNHRQKTASLMVITFSNKYEKKGSYWFNNTLLQWVLGAKLQIEKRNEIRFERNLCRLIKKNI